MTSLKSGVKLTLMKKLSLYIFLVLMWCNVGFAELIEFNKCVWTEYRGGKTAYKVGDFDTFKHEINVEDVILSIDLENGIISFTKVRTREYAEHEAIEWKKKTGKWEWRQFITTKYSISDHAGLTIEGVNAEGKKAVLVDLKNKRIDFYWGTQDRWVCENYNNVDDAGPSSGTAFFINNRGNLITNNHVVEGCKLSKINYFNKEYDTNLISTDKTLDLALLKVDFKPKDFISFSNKEPRKRQTIIVAGYPLGEYLSDDLKINEGKISSLKGFENNSNEITVDLAINPGNSGGPIVNENGQLVAVAVAGMSKEVTEGISFGIKSSAVTNFLKTNKISPDIKLTSFSMNDEKVNQLLEESTVYIFCE